MGLRRRYLPWLACAAVAATALPALAWGQADPPSSASIVVTDYAFHDAAGDDSTVEIPAGGTVDFSYPRAPAATTSSSSTPQPTSCKQTAGDDLAAGAAAALVPAGPRLGRHCTFDEAGHLRVPLRAELRDARHGDVVGTDADADADADADRRRPRRPRRRRPRPTPTPPRRRRDPTPARRRPAAPASSRTTRRAARNWFQDASSSDPADNSVTVTAGATRRLQLPGRRERRTTSMFDATKPTSCVQTAGHRRSPGAAAARVRAAAGLGGECTFDTPGHLHVRLHDAPRR